MEATIKLTLDGSQALGIISELKAFAELFPEVGKRLFGFVDTGAKLFRVHPEADAAGAAGEIRYRLEPTDFLLRFFAALRARDGDRHE